MMKLKSIDILPSKMYNFVILIYVPRTPVMDGDDVYVRRRLPGIRCLRSSSDLSHGEIRSTWGPARWLRSIHYDLPSFVSVNSSAQASAVYCGLSFQRFRKIRSHFSSDRVHFVTSNPCPHQDDAARNVTTNLFASLQDVCTEMLLEEKPFGLIEVGKSLAKRTWSGWLLLECD